MPTPPDLYAVLGVPRGASDAEIKRAFRKLAKEHHPDAVGRDAAKEEKFKQITAAYEILSDPKKRQAYDQFGSADAAGFDPSQFRGGFDFGGFAGTDFGDIFETFFGGGGRAQRPRQGEHLQAELELTFEEAVHGATKEVRYERDAPCGTCKGNGAKPGTNLATCDTCKGAGQVQRAQRTILGSIVTARTCPTCSGSGNVPETKCDACRGVGHRATSEQLKVIIPAGIDDGEAIRLSGKGGAGPGGTPPGDLYVRVRVRGSREFLREGVDIHSVATLSIPQVVLGDEIPVATVQGQVLVKIPPGTVHGTVLRLKGKGIRHHSGAVGSHLLRIEIDIPKKLTKEQKKLFEALKGF